MVAPTPAGVRRRVAIETATITVKASGAVQAGRPRRRARPTWAASRRR
jgi:hypothetical protein